MFSDRVPAQREPNRVAAALSRIRGRRPIVDLTVTNPTRVSLPYPRDLLMPLADPAGLTYAPEPLGLITAREAVAGEFERRGLRIPARQIVLTASTSEAYSLLFKLLCDAGAGAVLTPVPSYPLFDHLTRLDGVQQRRYALEYHGPWTVDFQSIDRQWTSDTRAVLVVSPNNPTGSIVGDEDMSGLVEQCRARRAALIIDEVFCDYPLREGLPAPVQSSGCLQFRLGGLSKSAGLPQVKLGWIGVDGPAHLVDEALDRLELIADTYLSVSTPVQCALPRLLQESRRVRDAILSRIRENDRTLRRMAADLHSLTVLEADAGWSAVVRVPAVSSEETLVLDLLERGGVLVHPGFFFDFPSEAFLVVSLLPEAPVFTRGIEIVLERTRAA
jgi:aspartate/methionine/tyrosine aminotransferase